MTCFDEKLYGLKLAFKLLCSLSEFIFACFDSLNSENTEWEFCIVRFMVGNEANQI